MKPRLVGFLALAVLLAACSGGPTLVASPDQPTSAPAPTAAAAPTSAATAAPAPTSAPAPTAASVAEATAAPATGAYSITDSGGTTLNFDKPPERIACLYTRCLEVLATLGVLPIAVPEWIAPIAQDPAYFPQPNEITVLAATNDDVGVDLEQLATLKPDLVLGWEELRAPLDGIAPVHAVANSMDSYQESHDEIRAFAKLLGREQPVEENIKQFLGRLAAYKQRAPGDRSIIYLGVGEELFYRDGQSGTCNLLKEIADCDWPDPTNQDTWSVATSIEGLLQLDPDVILVSDWAGQFADEKAMREELGKQPLWQELTAFKEGRVFLEPKGLNLDGMGTIGAARMLDYFAPLIYPEVFAAPLTDEEVAGS